MSILAVVVAGAWSGIAVAAAYRVRPPRRWPGESTAMTEGAAARVTAGALVSAGAVVAAVGRMVARFLPARWRPGDDDGAARRIGITVLVAVVALVVSPVASPAAAAATWFAPPVLAQRGDRRRRTALVADLPEVVDLLAVAVGAGLTVGQSVEAVVRRAEGPVSDALASAVRRSTAGGLLADCLDELPGRFGPDIRPLTSALAGCERYGSPVGPVLARLSDQLRHERRRRAEEAARRVPVKLLFPLVGCILPAFALLTVAPLIASAARSLRL